MTDQANTPRPAYLDKITVTMPSGSKYTGWWVALLNDHGGVPRHHLILDNPEREHFTLATDRPFEIIDTGGSVPPEVRTLATYVAAYERRMRDHEAISKQAEAARQEATRAMGELNSLQHKIKLAFTEAERKGYCDEVDTVAKAAGIERPGKEEFEIRIPVTGYVKVKAMGYTMDHAKANVRADNVRASLDETGDNFILLSYNKE